MFHLFSWWILLHDHEHFKIWLIVSFSMKKWCFLELLYVLFIKSNPTAKCTYPDLPSLNVLSDLGLHSLLGVISRTNNIKPDLLSHYALADQGLRCLQLYLTCKQVHMAFAFNLVLWTHFMLYLILGMHQSKSYYLFYLCCVYK